ncbi:MAG: hypothetical protein R3C44_05175 [Chloroflexota bacterium]
MADLGDSPYALPEPVLPLTACPVDRPGRLVVLIPLTSTFWIG